MNSKVFITVSLIASFFLIGYIFQSYLMSISVGAILAIATRPVYTALYGKLSFSHKRVYISSFLTLTLF